MFLFDSEKRRCPECSGPMIFGDLQMGGRGATLIWESRDKHVYKKEGLFKRVKTVKERIFHTLMEPSWDENGGYEEFAWYCPVCGIVDIRFRICRTELLQESEANEE